MSQQTEKQAVNRGNLAPRTLGKLALEVFSIVLGVLLALAVSEWQENRNNTEKASVALTNVRAELQSNLNLLQLIYPNNSKVVEGIESDQANTPEDATFIPGVQMRSSAWQTLATAGLGNFVDYQLLIELSQLYSMIEVYKQTAYSFIGANMDLAATATALIGTSPAVQLPLQKRLQTKTSCERARLALSFS